MDEYGTNCCLLGIFCSSELGILLTHVESCSQLHQFGAKVKHFGDLLSPSSENADMGCLALLFALNWYGLSHENVLSLLVI